MLTICILLKHLLVCSFNRILSNPFFCVTIYLLSRQPWFSEHVYLPQQAHCICGGFTEANLPRHGVITSVCYIIVKSLLCLQHNSCSLWTASFMKQDFVLFKRLLSVSDFSKVAIKPYLCFSKPLFAFRSALSVVLTLTETLITQ